jgi:hypothetical protein
MLCLFQLFVLLQDNGHNDSLKWPGPGDHHPGLDVKLGAIKQPIKEGLIGFWQRFFERYPSASFILNELTKRRERLAHGMILYL